MTICVAASAVAQDVHPYVGFFPISYSTSTTSYSNSAVKDIDRTEFNFGYYAAPIMIGVKISDFRADFEFSSMALKGFNGYYDFNVSDSMLPYLKLGVSYNSESRDDPSYRDEKYTSIKFAIGGGIGYKVIKNFLLDAGIEYNYLKYKYEYTINPGGAKGDNKYNTTGFTAKLGARYEF